MNSILQLSKKWIRFIGRSHLGHRGLQFLNKQILLVIVLLGFVQQPAVAVDLEIFTSGSADFFNPAFWTPAQVPTINDNIFVRSNGQLGSLSGALVEVNTVNIGDAITGGTGGMTVWGDMTVADNLLVGSNSTSQEVLNSLAANGTFQVANGSLFQITGGAFEHDFRMGAVNMNNSVSANIGGTARISNVTTVMLADDLVIGAGNNTGGSIMAVGGGDFSRITDFTVAGNFEIAHATYQPTSSTAASDVRGLPKFGFITNINVGQDFTIGQSNITMGPADPFKVRAKSFSSGSMDDVENVNIVGNMNIGLTDVNIQVGSDQVISDTDIVFTMERVDNITVGADFNVGILQGTLESSPTGSPLHSLKMRTIASQFQVESSFFDGEFNVGTININASDNTPSAPVVHETSGLAQLMFATMQTTGTTSVGNISGNANLVAANAFGKIIMQGASLTTPRMRIGLNENPDGAGTAVGNLELLPSYTDTELLELGEGGEIRFRFDGLDPVDPATVNSTFAAIEGTYPYIDADNAVLQGDIISRFEFTPPSPGTYSFDLIRSDSVSTIDATSANLLIENLPEDFCVIFYGVTEEDSMDILRLTISTDCNIPEPSSIVLLLLGAFSLIVIRCRKK